MIQSKQTLPITLLVGTALSLGLAALMFFELQERKHLGKISTAGETLLAELNPSELDDTAALQEISDPFLSVKSGKPESCTWNGLNGLGFARNCITAESIYVSVLPGELDWLALIETPEKITHITLNYIEAENIDVLQRFPNLKDLEIRESEIPNLDVLAELTGLIALRLSGTFPGDIEQLSQMKNLMYLELNGFLVDDLTPLAELDQLYGLTLIDVGLSDLSPLAGLPGLRQLRLKEANSFNSAQDNVSLAPLIGISTLNSLGLAGTRTSDLEAFKAMRDDVRFQQGDNWRP